MPDPMLYPPRPALPAAGGLTLGELVGHVPLDEIVPPAGRGFAARCDYCDWDGAVRSSSLAALGDFDRHARGAGHREATTTIPACPQCEHGEDDHLRRRGLNVCGCDVCPDLPEAP